VNPVCCSQDESPTSEGGVNGQRPNLLGVQQGALIGLYQIDPALSLRVYAGFDQSNDRCNALNLGLLEVPEQNFSERQIARMLLPQIDERSSIHGDNAMAGQNLI